MWDLDTIVRENNRSALQNMMMGGQLEEAQSPQPEAWALSVLADVLNMGPPLITGIIECLLNMKTVEAFLQLVRMLLPEYEKEIMAGPRSRRVYRFCYYFGQKYYPLPANTDCPASAWVESMPVELLGMSYSEYHDLDMRPGYLLLLSLVVYPYEGILLDEWDDAVPFDPSHLTKTSGYKPSQSDIKWVKDLVDGLAVGGQWVAPMGFRVNKIAEREIELVEAVGTPEVKETIRLTLLIAEKLGIRATFRPGRTAVEKMNGARVPLLDAVQRMAGEEIASLIPPNGWEPSQLHEMADNTPYAGIGAFADWVCAETGCVLLDCNFGDCEYVEGMGEPLFKWTQYNVDTLAEQWPKVKEIRAKIDKIVEWVEADPLHFPELVRFLLQCNKPAEPKLERGEYDETENWCPLEMRSQYEEDEEDD